MEKSTKALAVADMEAAQAKAKQAAPSIADWLKLISSEAGKLAQAGDFNAASKLFGQASKLQQQQANVEQQARIDAVADAKPKLVTAIQQAIAETLGADKLELIDGCWVSWDKAAGELSVSLFKPQSQPKQRSSNGTAKSYNLNTAELLAKHGNEASSHDGKSYNQLMLDAESMEAKTRSNFVYYQIRVKLIELDKNHS